MENRKPTDDEARVLLIGAWLSRFNDTFATYGKSIEERPTIFDSYEAALLDIPVDQLQFAFEQWNRAGTHFPAPGELRKIITDHEQAVDQYEAERAWTHVRWLLSFFNWSPDTGFLPICCSKETKLTPRVEESTVKEEFAGGYLLRPTKWDAKTEYAIQSVGGLGRIYSLPAGSEHDWARKGFLDAHKRHACTSGFTQIGRGEATQLLEGLQKRIEG